MRALVRFQVLRRVESRCSPPPALRQRQLWCESGAGWAAGGTGMLGMLRAALGRAAARRGLTQPLRTARGAAARRLLPRPADTAAAHRSPGSAAASAAPSAPRRAPGRPTRTRWYVQGPFLSGQPGPGALRLAPGDGGLGRWAVPSPRCCAEGGGLQPALALFPL